MMDSPCRPTVTRKANAWVAAVAKLPRADVVAHVGLCRIQTKVDVQHVTRTLTHAPGVHHEVVYRPRHRRQAPVVGVRVSADVVAKHVGAVAEDSIDVPLASVISYSVISYAKALDHLLPVCRHNDALLHVTVRTHDVGGIKLCQETKRQEVTYVPRF